MKFITNKYDLAKPMNTSIAMPKNSEFMLNFEIEQNGEKAAISPSDLWLLKDGEKEMPNGMGLIERAGIALENNTDAPVEAEVNIAYAYADSHFCINAKFWDPHWFELKLPTDGKIHYLGDAEVKALGITYVRLTGQNRTTQDYDADYSFYDDGRIIDNNTQKPVDSGIISFGGTIDTLYIEIWANVIVPANTPKSAGWRINFGYYGYAQEEVRPYTLEDKGTPKIVAEVDTLDATKDKTYTLVADQQQDKFTQDYAYFSQMAGHNYFTTPNQSLSAYEGMTFDADAAVVYEGWNGDIQKTDPTKWPNNASGIRIGDGVNAHGVWQLVWYASTGQIWFNTKASPTTTKTLTIQSNHILQGQAMLTNEHSETETMRRYFYTSAGMKFKQNIRIDVKDVSEGSLEKPVPAEFTNFITLSGTTTGGDEFSYEVPVKG